MDLQELKCPLCGKIHYVGKSLWENNLKYDEKGDQCDECISKEYMDQEEVNLDQLNDESDNLDEELGEFSDDFKIIHICGGELEIEMIYTEQSMADIDPTVLVMSCKKCKKSIRAKIWQ